MPRKLLVLDLDETLVYASTVALPGMPAHLTFDAYFVYKRPLLEWFLTEAARHFALAVWSSGGDEYVNTIVAAITPPGLVFELVWGRSRCATVHNIEYDTYYFEKRLQKLKKYGYALEHIILVDDSPEKARRNYGNAIYIKEYTGDSADNELPHLLEYLLTLRDAENVRAIEKRHWRDRL